MTATVRDSDRDHCRKENDEDNSETSATSKLPILGFVIHVAKAAAPGLSARLVHLDAPPTGPPPVHVERDLFGLSG